MQPGLTELLHRLGLDLPNPLPRHIEERAHFFERVAVAVRQPEAEADDFPLPVGKAVECPPDDRLEGVLVDRLERILLALVADKLAHGPVIALAKRLIERNRMPRHPPDAVGVLDRKSRQLRHLFDVRIATVALDEQPRGIAELRDHVDHVHRHSNRAALIGDRAGDRLSDPPGGIR